MPADNLPRARKDRGPGFSRLELLTISQLNLSQQIKASPVAFVPTPHHKQYSTVKMVQVPNLKLNSGAEMPQVGFGLWKVGNDIAPDVVYNAIKAGYRLFDGACGKLCFPASKVSRLSLGAWRDLRTNTK